MEQTINIEELIQDDHNFNKGTEAGQKLMEKSFKELGAGRSILVDRDGRIISGNKSQRAAMAAGIQKVRVIETTGDELIAVKRTDLSLDSKEGREMAYADNLTTQVNLAWDEIELEHVNTEVENFDTSDWGFDAKQLAGWEPLVPKEPKEEKQKEVKEDEFDEQKDAVPTVCALGDVWLLGEHRLMCGDSTKAECYETLMQGEMAQMCFTDPPYGYEYKSGWSRNGGENYDVIMNDDKILDFFPFVKQYCDGFVFVCTAGKVLDVWMPLFKKYLPLTNLLIWAKGGTGMGDLKRTFAVDYEVIMVSHQGKEIIGKRVGSVWQFNKDLSSSYVHPTQKPIALPAEAIQRTSHEGDIILDCFGGSGSTLIACEQLGRKARLMELDPHYCDVIIARWEKLTGKKAVRVEK